MSSLKLEYSRGDVLAGKYEVVDHLEESPLGLTYRAKHIKSGKYVRLTMLRPKVAGADQKEAVIAAFKRAKDLAHANIIKVGELGDHEGVAYYTMEDFEGGTLRELLQEYKVNGQQFQLREAGQIAIQVLEALQAAHEAGVVVRALRPEYILIKVRHTGPAKKTFVAQVKLLGLGFWDLIDAGAIAEDEFTRGEAQYLAPELKSFEPTASPRCDSYSAGVVFYETLTGTAPVGTFQSPTLLRPELPSRVNDIVELAMAMSPEDRYQSCRDFVSDIQRMIQDQMAGVEETESKPLITPLGWGLLLVLTVALGTIAYQLLRPVDAETAGKVADAGARKTIMDSYGNLDVEKVKGILANHPPNMAYIPDGPMLRGRMNIDVNAMSNEPILEVQEVKGFLIDVFEYPNKLKGSPKADVTHTEAAALCAEQGKRLCTALEWEKACKGRSQKIYTYGDFYDPSFCTPTEGTYYPAGTLPDCKSDWAPVPVFDMSGNFREWTSTSAGKGDRKIAKGGMRGVPEKGSRCAFQVDEPGGFKDGTLSFRCCRDVEAPAWKPADLAPAAPDAPTAPAEGAAQ